MREMQRQRNDVAISGTYGDCFVPRNDIDLRLPRYARNDKVEAIHGDKIKFADDDRKSLIHNNL